jgi:mycothiol system anti-sigma-R factor
VALSHDECRKILELIELYLDDELESSMRLEIHRHLEVCTPCTDHSEFQRRLKEILRAKCGCGELPAELVERIRASLIWDLA